MERLFLYYAAASLSASAVILLLAALRPVYRLRLSRTWQYYVWLFVVLRLIIPLAPAPGVVGRVMEAGLMAAYEGNSDDGRTGGYEDDYGSQDIYGESGEQLLSGGASGKVTPGERMEPEGGFAVQTVFLWLAGRMWLIWLVPAAAVLLYKIVAYGLCLRKLRSESLPAEELEVLEICRRAGKELGVRRPVEVRYCREAASPLLAGMMRPCILLPGRDYSGTELYYIIRHELVHLKRGDLLYKWLIQAAVSLHWFNPLVYLMRRECERACELSCDETVLSGLPPESRAAYGDTLIASLRGTREAGKRTISLSLCENTGILKERLESLMKSRKTTLIQKTAACGATACLMAVLLLLGGFGGFASAAKGAGAKADGSVMTGVGLNVSANPEKDNWGQRMKVSSFFNQGYGLQVAWNGDPALYKTTRKIMAGEEYTVSFTGETKRYADDPQILEAIRLSILEERAWEAEHGDSRWFLAMKTPVIEAVDGPYEGTYEELAVRFFEEKNVRYYAPVVKRAAEETKKELLKRSYETGEIAYFTLTADEMNKEDRREYLEKAYQDKRIDFFSTLVDELDEETAKSMADTMYKDRNISFFSVLFDSLPKEEQSRYAYRAYEDGLMEFFSVAMDSLDSYQQKELKERAKKEGKTAFLIVMTGNDEEDRQ